MNRVYVSGGLTDPTVPAESTSRVTVTVTVTKPTGQFVYQPGDPNKRHTNAIPKSFHPHLPITVTAHKVAVTVHKTAVPLSARQKVAVPFSGNRHLVGVGKRRVAQS